MVGYNHEQLSDHATVNTIGSFCQMVSNSLVTVRWLAGSAYKYKDILHFLTISSYIGLVLLSSDCEAATLYSGFLELSTLKIEVMAEAHQATLTACPTTST